MNEPSHSRRVPHWFSRASVRCVLVALITFLVYIAAYATSFQELPEAWPLVFGLLYGWVAAPLLVVESWGEHTSRPLAHFGLGVMALFVAFAYVSWAWVQSAYALGASTGDILENVGGLMAETWPLFAAFAIPFGVLVYGRIRQWGLAPHTIGGFTLCLLLTTFVFKGGPFADDAFLSKVLAGLALALPAVAAGADALQRRLFGDRNWDPSASGSL